MSTVDTYNVKGKKVGSTKLAPKIFDIKINSDLIYQTLVAQLANSRRHIAQTKDRSQVRGGGVKPWQQKGTGRARHGSIRSPIWKGGGVTFGPGKHINFKKKINKKMKQKAMLMVLSSKVKDQELILVDQLKVEKPKTKQMAEILENILKNKKSKNVLVVIPEKNQNIIKANKNIPYTKTILANNLNILDLLSFKYLLIPESAIKIIEKTYGSNV